jgi:hypothetical protein
MKMANNRLYDVRDTDTGKLVSDITNPRRKYWDRRGNAVSAMNSGIRRHRHKNMKLVVFELVEVADDGK